MSAFPYEVNITQSPYEFGELLKLVQVENVRSFLEVGSRWGGSLWKIANTMPIGSRIVSVDSGAGQGAKSGAESSLRACINALRSYGYDAHLIFADSQLQTTVDGVKAFAPFDMAFIDADHSFEGAARDWENYGPLARIVVLHDIAFVRPNNNKFCMPCEVPRLWKKIKRKYEQTREFIDPKWNMGIGVVWR